MIEMRQRSASWLLAATFVIGLGTSAAAETPMEEAYDTFREYRAQCTAKHGYDPDNLGPLSDFEAAPGEADWRTCVYKGVREILMPKTTYPDLYRDLIAKDQRLTQQVLAAQLTRQERRTLIEEMISDIRATESAHAALSDKAKTSESEQQRRDFTRRMINDLRGFTR